MLEAKLREITSCTNCPKSAAADGRVSCSVLGGEVRFWDPAITCPEDRWARTFLGPAVRPTLGDRAGSLAAGVARMTELAADAARSLASGPATPEVVAARLASCEACPLLVDDAGLKFCGACGCSHIPRNRVEKKVGYAYLTCPHPDGARPGFSNSEVTT